MTMTQTSIESWNGLITNYIKADNIQGQESSFVCTNVDVDGENMELTLANGDSSFIFSLNKTNKAFLQKRLPRPRDVIGKKLKIIKVKAMNPTTKQEVDALRIDGIE